MVIAFATQIVALLGLCQVFASLGILSATLIWTAIFVSHALRLVLTALVFSSRDWMHIPVDLAPVNTES